MSELNSYVCPPTQPKKQCETAADLHREWARVLDMCKGTVVPPYRCAMWLSKASDLPLTFRGRPSYYDFAVAIIQDKPAFIGDKLDHAFLGEVRVTGVTKNGKVILFDKGHCGDRMNCSWTPWNTKVSIQPTEYTSTPGAIKYVPDLGSALLQVNMKQLALAIEQRDEANRNLVKELNDLRARLEAIKNLGSV